jgi:hypothetical protein
MEIYNDVLLVVLEADRTKGVETRYRFRSRFDLNQFIRATAGLGDRDAIDVARRFVSTGRACPDYLA